MRGTGRRGNAPELTSALAFPPASLFPLTNPLTCRSPRDNRSEDLKRANAHILHGVDDERRLPHARPIDIASDGDSTT